MFALIVDTYYVGQLGTKELAAVSLTIPLIMGLMGLSMGIGVGASSLISRLIGSGEVEEARRVSSCTMLLVVAILVVLEVVGFAFLPSFFSLQGASAELLPVAVRYTAITLIGVPLFAIPTTIGTVLRAFGDVRIAATVMISGAILQIVIAPVLIFGLGNWDGWGVYGSAWSLSLSRVLPFLYACWAFGQFDLFRHPGSLRQLLDTWIEVVRLSSANIAMQLVVPVSVGILLAMLASYGYVVVAAFGLGSRIEIFVIMIFMALAASLTPIAGQNSGAQRFDRIQLACKLSFIFSIVYGIVFACVLFLLIDPIASLFRDDPAVVAVTREYFLIVSLSFGLMGIAMTTGSTFVGMGRPLPAFVLMVLRAIVLLIPLSLLFRSYWGYVGIFAAVALTNAAAGIASLAWFVRTMLKLNAGATPAHTDEQSAARN